MLLNFNLFGSLIQETHETADWSGTFGYELTDIVRLNSLINDFKGQYLIVPHKIRKGSRLDLISIWCHTYAWCSDDGE